MSDAYSIGSVEIAVGRHVDKAECGWKERYGQGRCVSNKTTVALQYWHHDVEIWSKEERSLSQKKVTGDR